MPALVQVGADDLRVLFKIVGNSGQAVVWVMLLDPYVLPSGSGPNTAGTTAAGVGQSADHPSNERVGGSPPFDGTGVLVVRPDAMGQRLGTIVAVKTRKTLLFRKYRRKFLARSRSSRAR
jgi:hypothetical protein